MNHNEGKGINRRDFLKTASALGIGLSIGLPTIVGFPTIVRSAQIREIKLGYQLGAHLHQWINPIGKAKGFFTEAGLGIQGQEHANVGLMAQQLAVGEMDIGLMGLTPAMLAKAQGADVIIIGTQNQAGNALVVAPDISKFEDLKNQPVGTIGVGSVQHALLSEMVRKYRTPVKIVIVKPTDMPIFAKNGEVKAVQVYEPFPALMIKELPGWRRLVLDTEIVPGDQCCVIVTSKKFAKDNPGVIEKILRIDALTTKYIRSYPEASIKIIAQASGYDESVIKDAYSFMRFPWPPIVNETASQVVLKLMVEGGKIDSSALKPSPEAWWGDLFDRGFEQKMLDSGIVDKLDREGIPV